MTQNVIPLHVHTPYRWWDYILSHISAKCWWILLQYGSFCSLQAKYTWIIHIRIHSDIRMCKETNAQNPNVWKLVILWMQEDRLFLIHLLCDSPFLVKMNQNWSLRLVTAWQINKCSLLFHHSKTTRSCWHYVLQRDPGGLAQGFVDLDLGCFTILLGQ